MWSRNEDGAISTTGGDETEVAVGTSEGNEKVASGSDELQVVADAVRSLPSLIVKDLLSIEVCVRCILRLLGIRGHVYSSSLLSPSLLCSVLEESKPVDEHRTENRFKESEYQESGNEALFCSICLGVLQFSYTEENGVLVRKACGRDFSESIAQVIKSQGHDIDGFSIEISLPQIILENEHSVRLSMKKKYGSEIWFHEKFLTEHMSVKDALKLSITNSLENFLAVKSGNNTFRIRLTYTHIKGSTIIPKHPGREHCHKRRKTDTSNALHAIDESQTNDVELSETSKGEENPVTKRSLDGLQDEVFHEHFESPLEKVNRPCQLEFHCYRTPIYIGGRYLKYSRNVSQTKWIIDDERMGEASVEEIIGSNILPVCRGDSYRFHAAGREDIDVRMLGSGRPFLIEVQNARCLPSMVPIGGMEDRINNLEAKLVRVKNLKMLGNQGWALMREGEAEKQKQYAALVWISRPLKDEDLCLLSSVKDMQILQRTPVRVLHRRSPLEREKIIHWMKVERIVGSEQYFLLHLCTQAGTYIKEFVHGDLGRTHPNIGSILECRAEILQLDVTDVKMDCFN